MKSSLTAMIGAAAPPPSGGDPAIEPDWRPGGIEAFIALATSMADKTGPVIMGHFRGALEIETKADLSPVTKADRQAERVMRDLIESERPDDGIFGEELGEVRTGADFVWYLDPIDGTKSFVTGKPLFGTLIGLAWKGVPVLGVMDIPALGERWVGGAGRKTTFNGLPARTRAGRELSQAWICATSPQMFENGGGDDFERLRVGCLQAVWGGDCYIYGLLANGAVDLVAEADLAPYDFAALVPIVEGAGGVMTGWRGEALKLPGGSDSGGRILAAGDKLLHRAALKVLTERI